MLRQITIYKHQQSGVVLVKKESVHGPVPHSGQARDIMEDGSGNLSAVSSCGTVKEFNLVSYIAS
jgi:hypothetical protein